MRHVLASGPISAAALGVGEAAFAAGLIALSRLAPAGRTGELCATAGAVDLSSITTAADQDLVSATFTDKEAADALGGRLVTGAATWTQIPFGAIMPRQSCPARCRARRRVNSHVRSAPRLLATLPEILTPTSPRCQRSARQARRAFPNGLQNVNRRPKVDPIWSVTCRPGNNSILPDGKTVHSPADRRRQTGSSSPPAPGGA